MCYPCDAPPQKDSFTPTIFKSTLLNLLTRRHQLVLDAQVIQIFEFNPFLDSKYISIRTYLSVYISGLLFGGEHNEFRTTRQHQLGHQTIC